MATVTFQILEGVDKGRVFRKLPTPFTIGREEGNGLRLNDERVSRFHAKVQHDGGDIILTDLESTNGTRVNGNVVQIRRLRVGDRVCVGRSLLLFGSNEEIEARIASLAQSEPTPTEGAMGSSFQPEGPATVRAPFATGSDAEIDFDVRPQDEVTVTDGNLFIGTRALLPMPQRLSPAQAARLAEILDFLHKGLAAATEFARANEEGVEIRVGFSEWQKILAVQMLLARYLRSIAGPDALED